MLKNILILGGLAVGGYFGYKWLTKKKATASNVVPQSNVVEYGPMYIPGLDPMAEQGYGLRGAPIQVVY